MSIPPVKFFGVARLIDVFVANINASHKCDSTVNHDYFSVVAIIQAVGKRN